MLSFLGIATVLGGDVGLSVSGIYHNVRTNPGGYIMAFADAVFWGGILHADGARESGR